MTYLDTSPFDFVVDREAFNAAMTKALPGVSAEVRAGLGLGAIELQRADDREALAANPGTFGGSWVGGLPTANTPWPQAPLPFILQIDFTDTFNNVQEWRYPAGVPTAGTLAFFHDTISLGDADDTPDQRPWAFVWSDLPAEAGLDTAPLAPAPDGVDPSMLAPVAPLDIDTIVTIQEPFSAPLPDEALRPGYHHVFEQFEYDQWGRISRIDGPVPEGDPEDPDFTVPEKMSRMFGWGACELREDQMSEVLAGLGAASIDDLVMLLELNPRTFENPDWFAGHPVQVWMLKTDLAAKDFSNTWCLVRTDS